MKYLTFGIEEKQTYKICILVNDIRRDEIKRAYIDPYGLDPEDIIVIDLHKGPASEMKAYIAEELGPTLRDLQVEYLLIGDGDYFKTFTGKTKVDASLGYMLDTSYGDWKVAYVPNFRTLFYDPDKVRAKIDSGVNALKAWMAGTYMDPGVDIIKFCSYPQTPKEIATWLQGLLQEPALSCDIEGFGLKHYNAGIGTITFCWSKHAGVSFPVDLLTDEFGLQDVGGALSVRAMLRQFFEAYTGKLIFHKIDYDVGVLVYQLFMEHLLDNEGMLYGLEVLLRDWDDTKLISYLATNSCAGNRLSLKDQAQEFAGDYSQGDAIKDIRKIPLPQLLQYNLVDGLSTWFVYEKHYDRMVADNQLEIYEEVFKPAIVDIIQMQLTGMPMDLARVAEVKEIFQEISTEAVAGMQGNPLLGAFVYRLKEEHVAKRNQEMVKKRISMSDPEVDKVGFNPNSAPQLQRFLYDTLGLPVIAYTDAKQPATGGKTLTALKNRTSDPNVLDFLDHLIAYKAVNKMLTDFIPSFEGSIQGPDGWHYLFGNFNLGGTVSGRLSSSDPNLQNIPANVTVTLSKAFLARYQESLEDYLDKGKLLIGKLVKSCFKAPPGWHFCGIDFASLEDRISALTTKDPNKLKVYTDGYDGHSLRAYSYFAEDMPDIDPNSVESINSIQDRYKPLRQDSKGPTFLLTYDGTWMGIVAQFGFTKEKAQAIEARYHELYQVSDRWVSAKLDQACKDGYVTVAFGLRVRTPLLAQVVRGTRKTPYEATAEGRTAGNAMGQSWCLLNSRAASEFMGKVRRSPHRNQIRICAQIHDANYFLVRDDVQAMHYSNIHMVKACEWQDHPDIQHDEVKLGGEFSIFYPDWSKEVSIPNGAKEEEIISVFQKHVQKVNQSGN